LLDLRTMKIVQVAELELAVGPLPAAMLGDAHVHGSDDLRRGMKMWLDYRGVNDVWFGYACRQSQGIERNKLDLARARAHWTELHIFPHMVGDEWYGLRFDAQALLHGGGVPEPVFV
jgi:hypothetical protein